MPTQCFQKRLLLTPCCICGPAERLEEESAFLFLRSSSSCMIFSAMVMLLGGFALLVELLAWPLMLLASPDRVEPACLRGLAGFEVDLSTLNPILKGAGADELDDEVVTDVAAEVCDSGFDADDKVADALSFVKAASGLRARLPRDKPMRIGASPVLCRPSEVLSVELLASLASFVDPVKVACDALSICS